MINPIKQALEEGNEGLKEAEKLVDLPLTEFNRVSNLRILKAVRDEAGRISLQHGPLPFVEDLIELIDEALEDNK